MLHDLVYRLRAFFSRPRVEDELQEELQYHLEREAEKYRKAGMEPEEAMRRARLALGIQVTLVGLLLGFAGALVLTRVLASSLFGVSALDQITFGAVPVLLLLVTIVACLIPAKRAANVDPMRALRYE